MCYIETQITQRGYEMKIIGYIRVSSEEQVKDGISLEMQRSKIEAYCNLNDMELVTIIEDAGISAKNINGRPGFQRALEMVYSGQADGLCVWKLDRAFRSTQDALNVAEKLNKKCRALISICEKLDTSSAIGEFFYTLMASLAQMERKLIGERTKAALQSKKSKGERVGQVPFGYRLQANGVHLEADPVEQEILRLIANLKTKGHSSRAIAAELNKSGHKTKENKYWTHVQIGRVTRKAA